MTTVGSFAFALLHVRRRQIGVGRPCRDKAKQAPAPWLSVRSIAHLKKCDNLSKLDILDQFGGLATVIPP
jgi:hypothetical protein